jgi:predicted phosphodiesterase
MIEIKGYNGFLFVGDPHLWSLKPSGRTDTNFTETVLNKIEQCVDIALEKNLYLIFLGDLFDSHKENDITLLTRLTRILKKSKTPFSTAEGNHEKSQTKLSDDVALKLLQESGTLYVFEQNKIWGKFKLNDGSVVYVGSTPYGEKIPTTVSIPESELKKNPDSDYKIIWLTHHDLDFGSTYPGAIPVKEINGAHMLINGHIHSLKKSMQLGNMVAHNPGNITRRSTDCKDHEPSAWEWVPTLNQQLNQIKLKFEKDVFDLIGKQIQVPNIKSIVPEELTIQMTSQFVQRMQEQMNNQDPEKNDDGTIIKDNLRTVAKAMNLDADFTREIIELADESIQEMRK